jgi:hypothetical protein
LNAFEAIKNFFTLFLQDGQCVGRRAALMHGRRGPAFRWICRRIGARIKARRIAKKSAERCRAGYGILRKYCGASAAKEVIA